MVWEDGMFSVLFFSVKKQSAFLHILDSFCAYKHRKNEVLLRKI